MSELIKYAIGIDVSKDKFDACFCEMDISQGIKIKSSHKFSNKISGFKDFVQWL